MEATTIKIEDPLLGNLKKLVPGEKSLSAFVREVLEQEIRRKSMIEAAEKYVRFIESNAKEGEQMAEWESADLESPPVRKRKKP